MPLVPLLQKAEHRAVSVVDGRIETGAPNRTRAHDSRFGKLGTVRCDARDAGESAKKRQKRPAGPYEHKF
jgi:hypothetical protein